MAGEQSAVLGAQTGDRSVIVPIFQYSFPSAWWTVSCIDCSPKCSVGSSVFMSMMKLLMNWWVGHWSEFWYFCGHFCFHGDWFQGNFLVWSVIAEQPGEPLQEQPLGLKQHCERHWVYSDWLGALGTTHWAALQDGCSVILTGWEAGPIIWVPLPDRSKSFFQ